MKANDNDLLASIERDEWKSVSNQTDMIAEPRKAATNTMLKDQRMNIRIGKRDLDGIKARALEEGIPHQTLVASIIHKYVNGSLIEI